MTKRIAKISATVLLIGGMTVLMSCSGKTYKAQLEYKLYENESSLNSEDVTWSDDVFENPSSDYDPDLAKICALMSASSASSDLPQTNFTSLGFSRIAKFNYDPGYSGDTVAAVLASRDIGETSLVGVCIRGTSGKEWYSNFDIGEGEEHKGFSLCADFLCDKTSEYIQNYELENKNIKFLVTGYSRGGAAANILAKRLCDSYGEENVYAYTFASPNTTLSENAGEYGGIFNLIKDDDFFTYVPFSEWGYRRYGTDIRLSSENESSPDEIKSVFRDITGNDFRGFSGDDEIKAFVKRACQLCPSPKDYYSRRFSVGDEDITMYEMMCIVSRFLAKEETPEDADFMASTLLSDFSDLSAFFLSGVDIEELALGIDPSRSAIGDSHSIIGYLILLERSEL